MIETALDPDPNTAGIVLTIILFFFMIASAVILICLWTIRVRAVRRSDLPGVVVPSMKPMIAAMAVTALLVVATLISLNVSLR